MAVKFTSVKCPECGANLPIEEGKEKMFCSYCGTQVIMTNENEHTFRHVDEAEIKRVEMERLLQLKELELEEKENERSRQGKVIAFSISGGLAGIGAISEMCWEYLRLLLPHISRFLRSFLWTTPRRRLEGLFPLVRCKLQRTWRVVKEKTMMLSPHCSVLRDLPIFKLLR